MAPTLGSMRICQKTIKQVEKLGETCDLTVSSLLIKILFFRFMRFLGQLELLSKDFSEEEFTGPTLTIHPN